MIDIKRLKFNKQHIIPVVGAVAVAGIIMLGCATAPNASDFDGINVDDIASDNAQVKCSMFENNIDMVKSEWEDLGYANIGEYHNDLIAKREEANGIADAAIGMYGGALSDEQKNLLREYEGGMTGASCFATYDKYDELIGEILAEVTPIVQQPVYSGGGAEYISNGSGLTKQSGVFFYGGRKETWYSQRVLPGGGLNIPGRHVASDGTIRDADGYICVAASDLPKGAVIETSLGTGKVYDTGCAPNVTDIYTDW